MGAEPGLGGVNAGELESGEVELRLVDLGDAVVETRQSGNWVFTDCVMAINSNYEC